MPATMGRQQKALADKNQDKLWYLDKVFMPKKAAGADESADKNLAQCVQDRLKHFVQTNSRLITIQKQNATLYGDESMYRVSSLLQRVNRLRYGVRYNADNILNVIESCVDSAHNKISKIKPLPTLDKNKFAKTSKLALENAESRVRHSFKYCDIWEQGQDVFQGAGISELSWLKASPKRDIKMIGWHAPLTQQVFVENPFFGGRVRDEIFEIGFYSVDQVESDYGIKLDKKDYDDKNNGFVKVVECYKAFKYHVICTENRILLKEKWALPIPYLPYIWKKNSQGIAGKSIATQLAYIQAEITEEVMDVSSSFRQLGFARWLSPTSANVSRNDLANVLAGLIEYSGQQSPELITPNVISDQYFQWIRFLIEQCYQLTGISEIYSSGELPAGLREGSGSALRTYDELRSDRFQIATQNYERLFERAACFALHYEQKFWRKEIYKGIDGNEIKLKEVEAWATNILTEHPAGKRQEADELYQAGIITRDQYLEAIEFGNIDEIVSQETLTNKAIEKEIDMAIKGNKPLKTSEILGYENQLNIASRVFRKNILNDEPEKNDKLGDFIIKLESSTLR